MLTFFGAFACAQESPKNNLQSPHIAFASAMMLGCLNITEYGYALKDLKKDLDLEEITGELTQKYPSQTNAMRYPSSSGHVIIETGMYGDGSNVVCSVYLHSDRSNAIKVGDHLEEYMTVDNSPFQFQNTDLVKGKSSSHYLWVRQGFNIGLILTRSNFTEDGIKMRVVAGTYRTLDKSWGDK